MANASFGDMFAWGVSTSATQSDGAAPSSDWAGWERSGRAESSGSGNDFINSFSTDFELLAAFGLTHHKLSLPWARIEPREGHVDYREVERYRALLSDARSKDVAVWATLLHYTIPGWLEDAGGIADGRFSYQFANWVDRCGENFGDLVHGWVPIHNPAGMAYNGFVTAALPPGRTDRAKFGVALENLMVSARDSYRLLRGSAPIATSWTLSPVRPNDATVESSRAAAVVDHAMWKSMIRGFRDGIISIPGRPERELDDLVGHADVVGFNYRGPVAVSEAGSFMHLGAASGVHGTFWAEGIASVMDRLATELPSQVITATAIEALTNDDNERIDAIASIVQHIGEALRSGVRITGANISTGVDAYQWDSGWAAQSGVFDRSRTPRNSAYFLKQVISTGNLSAEEFRS